MLEVLAAIAGAVVLVAVTAIGLGLRRRKQKAPTTDQIYPLW